MIRDNLKAAIRASRLKVKEIASLSGVTKPTIDGWLSARSYEPTPSALYAVCKAIKITMEQAVDGEAGLDYVRSLLQKDGGLWDPPERIAPLIADLLLLDQDHLAIIQGAAEVAAKIRKEQRAWEVHEPEPEYDVPEIQYTRLPLVGRTAAGIARSAIYNPDDYINVPGYMIKGESKDYFCITVCGMSMFYAGINDRDIALIKITDVPEYGRINLIYARERSMLKRLEKKGDTVFAVWDDGSDFRIALESDEFRVQGLFVGVLKDQK